MSNKVQRFKFYAWSNSVRLTLLADSPMSAAKRLVSWAMDRDLMVEFDETISVSQMGFEASSLEFQTGCVIAALASE